LKIAVKYSIPFREDAGVREETYEVDWESITVAEVLDLVVGRHSSMSKFVDKTSEEAQRHQLVIAVNSRVVRLCDEIYDGDSVSVLLPVIGGYGK
jgi:molybdopterin converting factor small subunit